MTLSDSKVMFAIVNLWEQLLTNTESHICWAIILTVVI